MNALGKRSSSGPHAPLAVISRRRRAFTLTELLVVIAIIAVLASLVSVAVMKGLETAKQTRIKAEVDQLDLAMKAYKEKYGSYPPCYWLGLIPNSGGNPLLAHIASAFPRYDLSNRMTVMNDLKLAIPDFAHFRPDQALVFWLSGFSPDPAHPFVTPDGFQISGGTNTGVKVQRTPLFDFDKTRLAIVSSVTNPIPSYFPPGSKLDATGAPYLYWSAGQLSYGDPPTMSTPDPPNSPAKRQMFNDSVSGPIFINAGTSRPYALDTNGNGTFDNNTENWANPDSFQIIAAGLDGKYGDPNATGALAARLYPTGTRYDVNGAEDDNVTNFCNKARLGDAKP